VVALLSQLPKPRIRMQALQFDTAIIAPLLLAIMAVKKDKA
jgi:hypothetical protein